MSTPMIDIQNLEMVIAGRRILKVDSLHIARGEKVAILGRNGAGKSTLLRCLNGFVKPTAGHIVVNRHTVFPLRRERDLRPVRAEVGQVLQGLHLVARLSAMENVLVGGLARMPRLRSWARIFTNEETQRAQAALKAVGMAHLAEKRADKLSGGERQKVAIARMLVQQPELVLADEPTAALDPTAAISHIQRFAKFSFHVAQNAIVIQHTLVNVNKVFKRFVEPVKVAIETNANIARFSRGQLFNRIQRKWVAIQTTDHIQHIALCSGDLCNFGRTVLVSNRATAPCLLNHVSLVQIIKVGLR